MELEQGLDTRERQDAIDSFLGSLSSWDLLYLRRQMHVHEARIKLASLDDLPAEIIISIAQFLELEDLLTCARISRSWRAAWTFGAVTAALCCRYFPGLTEMHGLPHSAGQALFAETARRYIEKYLRPRPNAIFSSRWFVGDAEAQGAEDMREDMFHRSQCLDFGLDRVPMFFQDGVLAWQPDDSYVVISDLRKLSRTRCGFGGSLVAGNKLDLQAATPEMLVFSSIDLNAGNQACRELQIYNMLLGEWRRLSLPARFAKCYALKASLVAMTCSGDAFYWSWGGPMVDLQAAPSPLTASPKGCVSCLQKVPGAILHPTEVDTLFLAWVYSPTQVDEYIHVIVVVKYKQGKPVQRYQTQVANPAHNRNSDEPFSRGTLRFSLRCQKMNSHGQYMLGATHTCLRFDVHKSTMALSEWSLVCFNTLTETFMYREYKPCLFSPKFHRPTWEWADWHSIEAWDDYLVVLWQPRPHVIHEPCTFTQLLLATDNVACIATSQEVFADRVRTSRFEPAVTIDTFHLRRSAVASHFFMDDDLIVYAAPDSVLVSTFRKGKDVVLPPPMEANPMARLAMLETPSPTTPPQLVQAWDCEVYTTLEVAPRSASSSSLSQ